MSALSRQEIARMIKEARRVLRHPGLDILVAPKALAQARILVVTPRKVGNAPTRNKIRRRLKAIFYEEKLFDQGFDCIIFIKAPASNLSFDELKQILVNTLAASVSKN